VEKLEVLEDAADVPAQLRNLGILESHELAAAHDDPAARGLELLEQETHDRRLARPGRSDEEDELAFLDREGNVAKRDHVWLVDLLDVLEHDHRRARRRGRRLGLAVHCLRGCRLAGFLNV